MLREHLTQRVEIPLVTWLFEELMEGVGPSMDKLTVLGLLAFAAACPFNVVATLATGHAPFGRDPGGDEVRRAIAAIDGFLGHASFAQLQRSTGTRSVQSTQSTADWERLGAAIQAIVGGCTWVSSIASIVPNKCCGALGLLADTVIALFTAPMWGIALREGAVDWVALGLDLGAWAVSLVPVLLGWLLFIPDVLEGYIDGFIGWLLPDGLVQVDVRVPVGQPGAGQAVMRVPTRVNLAIALRGVREQLGTAVGAGLRFLKLLTSAVSCLCGFISLGLSLGASITLLSGGHTDDDTVLELVTDTLENVAAMVPFITAVLLAALSDGAIFSRPDALQITMMAPAAVPRLAAGSVRIARVGLLLDAI